MNYGEIKTCDIANGEGVRVSLFVSGCTHHCKNCFNDVAWDFGYGKPFTEETEEMLLKALEPDFVDGLSLLGGEPFEPEHQYVLLSLLQRVRREFPQKTIWAYSGYVYEELSGKEVGTGRARCEVTDAVLACVDVLVDGEFMKDKKNISLQFRGSENQRLIDLRKTEEAGEIVWWKQK